MNSVNLASLKKISTSLLAPQVSFLRGVQQGPRARKEKNAPDYALPPPRLLFAPGIQCSQL